MIDFKKNFLGMRWVQPPFGSILFTNIAIMFSMKKMKKWYEKVKKFCSVVIFFKNLNSSKK